MDWQRYSGRVRVRACGILEQNGRILLVKMLGLGEEGVFWAPPGGGVEFGESIAQTIMREFREETGLEVEVHGFMGINEYIRPPLHAIELFYRVVQTGGTLALGTDPETSSQTLAELRFFSKQQAYKLPSSQLHPSVMGFFY